MKCCPLFTVVFLSISLWGAPGESYPVSVHVSSSRYETLPGRFDGSVAVLTLNVVIDGKKYELGAEAGKTGLLAPGDYKARLLKDEHVSAYESRQEYEFQFPDKRVKKFYVIGQSE